MGRDRPRRLPRDPDEPRALARLDGRLPEHGPTAEELVEAWRDHGREVTLYGLPSTPKLEHHVIDPGQRWARPGFVYPRLFAHLERTTPPSR